MNEIRPIKAKIIVLSPPEPIANFMAAAVDKTPVAIQMISIASKELFLILKIDCCTYLPDFSFFKPWVRFETSTHHNLVLICDLNKAV